MRWRSKSLSWLNVRGTTANKTACTTSYMTACTTACFLACMATLITACSPGIPAPVSPTDRQDSAQASAKVVSPTLTGAWAQTDPFSPEVQEAARFAVQTFAVQNKTRVLVQDVSSARQQVVAGVNFELQLQVRLDGVNRNAKARVWRQTDGRYSLQAWDWLD